MGNRAAWNRVNKERRRQDVPTWCIVVEIPAPSVEERERIAREDADIARRRAAFPLH